MQFKKDAEVISSEGEKIGTLDRVVMDPQTREVAYLVVRSGILLREDRLIPMGLLKSVTGRRIEVKTSKKNLNEFTRYDSAHYIPAEHQKDAVDDVDAYYWYPPAAGPLVMGYYPPFTMIPVTAGAPRPETNPDPANRSTPPVKSDNPAVERDIPKGMVALKEGAKVIARDDQHVGDIERLLIDQESDRLTHFVISRGVFLKEKKLIPAYWLTHVDKDEVHLAVDSNFLNKVPDFRS
ncbi:MAG: PRC-barrel domain-containing protein [Chloroflexota bacterium]